MFKRHQRISLIALLAGGSLLLTACFRDTSEAIQQQPVARQVASPTVVEEAEPTAPPPTATEEPAPTEQDVDQFALTATALIALQTQSSAAEGAPAGIAGDESPALPATAIPLPRATIPPGEDCAHEIRVGDTLYQLSLAYGVTVNEIAQASGIENPDRIAVGQHVTIPECGTTGFIPPPTSIPAATIAPASAPATSDPAALELAESDTRDARVEQAQTSLLDNAQADAEADFSIQSAAAAGQAYTVRQNDTLYGIAIALGTTVEILAALNDIADVDDLAAGTVLQTP